MKIGIITYHNANNYGALLQTYALQTHIESKGHKVDIINYTIPSHKNIEKQFMDFINTTLNTTKKEYFDLNSLKEENFDYDALICGSDQIWNLDISGWDPAYFIDFARDDILKISYAASISKPELPSNEKLFFKAYLKNLDYVSVREAGAVEILKELTHKKVVEALDPTLLLEKADYDKIKKDTKIDEDYMYVHFKYIFNEDELKEAIKVANKVSKVLNLKIIHNLAENTFENEIFSIADFGVQEFLGIIASAKFVVNNSFHCSVFAMHYEKDFINLTQGVRPTRILNLLEKLNLTHHVLTYESQIKDINKYKINHQKARDELKKYVDLSENFIDKSLNGIKNKENEKTYFDTENEVTCAGCKSCEYICPESAISMELDEEGFIYPVVNKKRCIKCDFCKERCIYKNKELFPKEKDYPKTFACKHKNDKVRKKSSSGGIFTGLYNHVIKNNGYVVGVKFNNKMEAVYEISNKIEDCKKFRGSKYIRAKQTDIFPEIKGKLENENIVLVVGTSCFIAGLKTFLNKEYDNLYLIDFICFGTPSPKIFKKYIEYLNYKHNSKVVSFNFRSKYLGWPKTGYEISLENGQKIKNPLAEDLYCSLFIKALILRPSCHVCEFTYKNRIADITIGDFWGIDESDPDFSDSNGISCVIQNTSKGEKLFNAVENDFTIKEKYFGDAFKRNHKYTVEIKRERHGVFERANKYNPTIHSSTNVESSNNSNITFKPLNSASTHSCHGKNSEKTSITKQVKSFLKKRLPSPIKKLLVKIIRKIQKISSNIIRKVKK